MAHYHAWTKAVVRLALGVTCCWAASLWATDAASFDIGGDFRVRQEWYNHLPIAGGNNAGKSEYTRVRTRVWLKYGQEDRYVYLRLGNEWRSYIRPTNSRAKAFPDELFVDNLYVQLGKLRIGRQDFTFGSPMLFVDPSAGDGSRSGYFDGVTYEQAIGERTTLHYFALYNSAHTDLTVGHSEGIKTDHVPLFSRGRDDDAYDAALGLYAEIAQGDLNHPTGQLDLYAVYKRQGDDGKYAGLNLMTVGLRYVKKPTKDQLAYEFELAGQFGETDDDRIILSMMNHAKVSLPLAQRGAWSPACFAAYTYFSGGEGEGNVHAWNPIFGRGVPQSEVLCALAAPMYGGGGYWTNSFYPHVGMTLKHRDGLVFETYTGPIYLANANDWGQGSSQSQMGWLGRIKAECPIVKDLIDMDGKKRGSITLRLMFDYLKSGDYFKEDDLVLFGRTELFFSY